MKKALALTTIPFALLALVGCSTRYHDIDTGRSVEVGELVETDHKIKIGILQPVEHVALGLARQGFVDGLKEEGYVDGENIILDYRNGGGNDASELTLAKSLVSKNEINLGIGTGSSQKLKAAEINAGKSNPLLFTAVTDPVSGELVSNVDEPEGFVTGTSDMNPVAAQIQLIKECLPNATKIGILYTQTEINSKVQADMAEEEAEKQGLQVEIQTATNSADIQAAAQRLTQSCQAIYVPTDNNIASNLNAVKVPCESAHVLLVSGEEGMLQGGAHITLSIDYYELGKTTGKMAVSLINGSKSVKDLPVKYMSTEECEYVLSSSNLAAAGITLPSAVTQKCRDINA